MNKILGIIEGINGLAFVLFLISFIVNFFTKNDFMASLGIPSTTGLIVTLIIMAVLFIFRKLQS